jgi:crotonobetainyl-CoA:carnitine CoA-transferase CaiB-like acyl-CoA transferase
MQAFAPQPLAGVQVAEFSHVIAGPFAGLQLQQLGASVVKVEPPAAGPGGGDYLGQLAHGQRAYVALNAAKTVQRIDLKSAAGRADAWALAAASDVLIDSYRPGVLARHGLAYTALAAANPRLIVCSISGYGSELPGVGTLGAYDHVMQALTGVALQTGNEGDPPIKVGFPLVDSAVGLLACNAVLAALLERGASGRGQFIEISMWRAALQLMYPMACELLSTRVESPRVGNGGYTGSPGASFFECADGWLALGANTPAQLGRAALALQIAPPDWTAQTATFPSPQTVFGDALKAVLLGLPVAQAEARLGAQDVPVAAVLTLNQFLQHAVAQGWLAPVAAGSGVLAPGPGWRSFRA